MRIEIRVRTRGNNVFKYDTFLTEDRDHAIAAFEEYLDEIQDYGPDGDYARSFDVREVGDAENGRLRVRPGTHNVET